MTSKTPAKDSAHITNQKRERIIPILIEGRDFEGNSSPKLSLKQVASDQVTVPVSHISPGSPSDSSKSNNSILIEDGSDNTEKDSLCESVQDLSISPKKQEINCENEENQKQSPTVEEPLEIPERSLPTHNVPEKIVIVLDRALDENFSNFELTNGKKYNPLFMLKRAIHVFVVNKNFINPNHQFALAVLNQTDVSWIHDFTSSPEDIVATLDSIKECQIEDIFDLNTLFDVINQNITINPTREDLLVPPPYVVHTILLYGRSYTLPQITVKKGIQALLNSPYFTLDVIMTHEPPNTNNNCEKIFKMLQSLDTKGFAYFFSVSRNSSDLLTSMAKLLSHPLQRPIQYHANYKLTIPNE